MLRAGPITLAWRCAPTSSAKPESSYGQFITWIISRTRG
jgi:hypothetical protein